MFQKQDFWSSWAEECSSSRKVTVLFRLKGHISKVEQNSVGIVLLVSDKPVTEGDTVKGAFQLARCHWIML